MRKSLGTAALTLASAALAIGLAATSALATTAKTFTVKPGGAITGKAGTTKVTDTTSGLTVTCTSSDLTGSLKSGSGLSGHGIGMITALDFNNCTVDGITLNLASGPVKYSINALAYKSGITKGTITKIHFVISSSECSAVIDGTSASAHNGKVTTTFSNKTNTLKVLTTGSTLHAYDVKGCLGAISDGDAGTISASLKLTPAQTIT
jgi:hypothetical protein